MYKVFLSLGSNLGNRVLNLENAIKKITHFGKILKVGCLYETEPWGFTDEHWFINTVIEIETNLSAKQLLEKCLFIEKEMGRIREYENSGYNSRPIDIDILFFSNEIINLPKLTIPHKHLHKRKFVLAPLNDITPELIHPVIKQSVKTLLENCPDEMELKMLNQTLG